MTEETLREIRDALKLGPIEMDEYELLNASGDVVVSYEYPKNRNYVGGITAAGGLCAPIDVRYELLSEENPNAS